MNRLTIAAVLVLTAGSASPAVAQFNGVDLRPYVLVSDQRFAAKKTFDATFQSTFAPFWGGGVDLVVHKRYFIDFAVSRMSKTGQRYIDDSGTVFRLGIASHVTITPVELSGGYRFGRRSSRIRPYASGGIGWYHYTQVDDFSEPAENVDETHAGFVATGGVEFRLAKWIGIAGDARYTHIPGILGQAAKTSGSQLANETDLGGVAARVRVMLGR